MTAFPAPRPLTVRITDALANLRALREWGNKDYIEDASNHLDQLLDRYPRRSTAEESK